MGDTTSSLNLWPRPQQVREGRGTLALGRTLKLQVEGEAAWLAGEAKKTAGLVNAAAGRTVASARGKAASLTITDMDGLGRVARSVQAVRKGEGYVLRVTPRGVILAGADAPGLFHGAQTLAQLVQAGNGKAVPCVTIRDWPRFPIRGAHVFMPSERQVPFFLQLLDYLASLKFNTLYLEIAAGMEFKSHPEINRAWLKFMKEAKNWDPARDPRPDSLKGSINPATDKGKVRISNSRYFPKDGYHGLLAEGGCIPQTLVKRLLRECAKRHIEVVPEVQSLSHCYWLCIAHPEIREREDDPYPCTYCPSNPRTYELLFECMDEVIEVFRPRMVHIGHDEWYNYAVCPVCRKRRAPELLAEDVKKIHGYLAERGIRTMMWGDRFLNIPHPRRKEIFPAYGGVAERRRDPITGKVYERPAVYQAVDMVPKDILICDWYWEYETRSERIFAEHGLRQIFGNFSPFLCEDWEARSNSPNVLGGEVSSWCGVSVEHFAHNGVLHACYPSADLFWNGTQAPREQTWKRMARVMPPLIDTMRGAARWLVSGEGTTTPVDISAVAEILPHEVVGRLRTGDTIQPVTGRGSFALTATPNGYLQKAVVLKQPAPHRVTVPVGRKASHLLLLHGTTMADAVMRLSFYSDRPTVPLLRYRVRYADGKRATFEAHYGRHIGLVFDHWPMPIRHWLLQFCWEAVPVEVGDCFKLFAQEWVNPRPRVAIDSLTIELADGATPNGAVLVPGISVVEA